MNIVKDVWQGRDNEFVLRLDAVDVDGNATPTNLSVVTSALLELEDSKTISVDRNDGDPAFNWWSGDLEEGEMRFSLGVESIGIEEGNYPVRLTLFSLSHEAGIVWTSFARNELSVSIHETGL